MIRFFHKQAAEVIFAACAKKYIKQKGITMETLTSVNGSGHKKVPWPFFREIGKQTLFGSICFCLVTSWMFLGMYLFSSGIYPTRAQVGTLALPVMGALSLVVCVTIIFTSFFVGPLAKMKQFTEVLKGAALYSALIPIVWVKIAWFSRCWGKR